MRFAGLIRLFVVQNPGMRPVRTIALVVLLALGVLPAAAQADGDDVVSDCTKHGTLTRKYPQKDYKDALASLPADVDEYGDCRDVIRNAQLAGAGKDDDGGSGPTLGAGYKTGGGNATSTSGDGTRTAGSSGGDDGTAVDPDNTKASNPDTVDENKALIDATRNGGGAVKLGEDAIAPGSQSSNRFAENLPAPVVGVISLMGLLAIVGAVLAIRRRLRGA
jgi:hypothetical protein